MKLELQTPPAVKDISITLHRSREAVKVFLDEACTKPVAFDRNHRAKLEGKVAVALCKGEAVPAWTRADDAAYYLLRLHVSKATKTATLVPGDGFSFQVGRGYGFLDGPSRFLQLVDSFENVLASALQNMRAREKVLAALQPSTDQQKRTLAAATSMADALAQARMQMSFALSAPVSYPLLLTVVGWVVCLFCGFGMTSRATVTSVIALAVGSIAVASAVLLILDLSNPYSGVFRASPAPLEQALAVMGKE